MQYLEKKPLVEELVEKLAIYEIMKHGTEFEKNGKLESLRTTKLLIRMYSGMKEESGEFKRMEDLF